jgi:hypothetical protein
VGPGACLDNKEKILGPTETPNFDPSVVQPIASRYTNYAIPALEIICIYTES